MTFLNRLRSIGLAGAAAAAFVACQAPDASSSGADAEEGSAGASPRAVTIVEPAQGAEVEGPDVRVRLEASGIDIVPAGDTTAGTGHHHLFLDTDVSGSDEPVPAVPGSVVHLGDGSSGYTFEGVGPGTHRLIAVVADGLHVPLKPWVVDTVTFTVR